MDRVMPHPSPFGEKNEGRGHGKRTARVCGGTQLKDEKKKIEAWLLSKGIERNSAKFNETMLSEAVKRAALMAE